MSADITTIVIEEHQLSETEAWLSLNELCERCGLEPPLLIELVDIGLITPSVVASDQWRFQTTAVPALHQALRIESRHLPEQEATVCWRKGSQFGLVLDRIMPMADLAERAAAMQGAL